LTFIIISVLLAGEQTTKQRTGKATSKTKEYIQKSLTAAKDKQGFVLIQQRERVRR
jgi:hypothetical protein